MALASLLQSGAKKTTSVPAHVTEKYDVEKELASGKFGVVFQCKDKKSKEPVAVKVMLKKNNKKEDVEREVIVLRGVNHPHLLQVRDFSEDKDNYVLVMELLSGGELFDYCAEKEYLVEAETVHFMKQILSGLEYLHNKQICHLDLKPENIVLKDLETKQLKIIDFGTAQDLTKSKSLKAMVGTPEFIAPEVLNFEPVTCAADMWAIGVIAFCLLTGCSPFLGDDDHETLLNISSGEYEYPGADPDEDFEDISDGAKSFIDDLLLQSPKERSTASQSLKHKWMQMSENDETSGNRINLDRLRKLRRRRKLQAAFRAVRLGMSLFRRASGMMTKPVLKKKPVDGSVSSVEETKTNENQQETNNVISQSNKGKEEAKPVKGSLGQKSNTKSNTGKVNTPRWTITIRSYARKQ